MKRFKLYNNIVGWVVFLIAAVTYLLTIESTASFWDCGEFISTAYKLDVGHPPGAPFFMLTAHFFTLFAKDPTMVAVMVNAMSAIFSALTILFLFWTITALARKIVVRTLSPAVKGQKASGEAQEMTLAQGVGILFAGAVGALAYTFSDTFWFSAVEGEVYAYSSFFTAVVFWAILKWDDVADSPDSDRWIILIAYLMGLSIGVHLLNLLAIPAIVLVYYCRKYEPTFKGFIIAMLVSVVLLGVVLYGLIPGFVQMACWFELLFTNMLHAPFNTGLLVYIVLTVGILAWAIWQTAGERNYNAMCAATVLALTAVGIPFFGRSGAMAVLIGAVVIAAMALLLWLFKHLVNARFLHTVVISAALMLLGYSTYAVIVIRSGSDPAMDQNSPDNVFNLKSYLNREQYGDRPLLYGPVYNAPVALDVKNGICEPRETVGAPQYAPKPKMSPDEKDEYVITGYKHDYVMDDRFMMIFPRMYSAQSSHIEAYKAWGNVKGKRIKFDYCGRDRVEYCPTFVENLRFFFAYQCHFMYWRYFMWNFAGRQNDLQGHGEVDRGNWISGIPFLDNLMLGDQSKLPDRLKENKGHNVYYMLPLLLGLLGIGFQLSRGRKGFQNFMITFLLFFLTGLAIVVYLNQTPYQPRERDYAYAGSFYAFCIWIGMGVLALIQLVEDLSRGRLSQRVKTLVAVVAGVLCLGVPALMAQQNWDDHDRSGRYVCRDFGQNYLNSCRKDAIIFTNGDNDTFPLWYNQEVEEFRTDVRVCNLSYLQTDWYIDQMRRPYYESPALPISWKPNQYQAGTNEIAWVRDQIPELTIDQAFNWMLEKTDQRQKKEGAAFWNHEDVTSELPTAQLYQPIVPEEVLASPAFSQGDSCRFSPEQMAKSIAIPISNRLTRSEMMILDIIRNNHWKRPVYFAVTVGSDYYLHIDDYFELTGLAYQLTPVKHDGDEGVNTVDMYDNMMHKFKFGGVDEKPLYLDENVLRMCHTHRLMFARLADALIVEGEKEKALEVLDYGLERIPTFNVPHDYSSLSMAQSYYQLGENAKADQILTDIADNATQYIDYYQSLNKMRRQSVQGHLQQSVAILGNVLQIAYRSKRDDIVERYQDAYMRYSMR
ncbi:MAG: DUF2723 domain-containing protein [Paludibacteraceae bacterium]|nr:DUF2723 domain-containing protein [Paludibacteraceae bacterium]